MSHFSVRDASSFLFWSSKFSALSRHEAPSKSLQGFTLCFQLLFLFIILFLPEFFMEALHGGSSRILLIPQLFFKFSLEVMIRQAILKIKHGAQHMFCFEEIKYSLISSGSLRSLVSKFSQVSLFIFQFFLVMRSFSLFVLLILTVVRPTFLFRCYHTNSFIHYKSYM